MLLYYIIYSIILYYVYIHVWDCRKHFRDLIWDVILGGISRFNIWDLIWICLSKAWGVPVSTDLEFSR